MEPKLETGLLPKSENKTENFSRIKLEDVVLEQKKVGESQWIEGGEEVESFGKLFKSKDGRSKRLVVYVGGFPGGSGTNDFEQRVVPLLLDNSHDVFVARHPGAVVESDKADVIIGSEKKREQAIQNKQSHLGKKDVYSMEDISLEAFNALKNLGKDYEQIDIVGHSFGSLGMMYSTIKMEKEDKELAKKIKSLTSISGFISPLKGEKGVIDEHSVIEPEGVTIGFFGEEIKGAVNNGRYRLGDPEEELQKVKDINKFIYEEDNRLPENLRVMLVSGRYDGSFTPLSTMEFAKAKARESSYFVEDYMQGREAKKKDPSIHSFKDFNPKTLVKVIEGNIPEEIKTPISKRYLRINPENVEHWEK